MRPKPQPLSNEETGLPRGRPVPVRELMEGGDGPSEPARTLEADGEEWVVVLIGSTSAGMPTDARAPLILVGFARGSAPETLEREALAPATSLDDLSDDDLVDLLGRSRPARLDGSPESGASASI